MAASTCERSLQYLKKNNIKAGKVEMPWNQFSKVRKDYLNIIDIIALDGADTIGIQACGADINKHITKIVKEEFQNTLAWLSAGNCLELWAWRLLQYKRGSIAKRWNLKKIEFFIDERFTTIHYREVKQDV